MKLFGSLLLCIACCNAQKTVEIDWVKGFTDASARATSVNVGDVLNFSWKGVHNVFVFPTKEAFDACDFGGAKSIGFESPVSHTVTGTAYFACSVQGHCPAGQKLAASATASDDSSTIVGIAVANPDRFSTLVTLVQAAGLVDILSGAGPFTVFAPTNEAFAALPASAVEWLTAAENKDALTQVLTYHVVSGNVMSTDLVAGDVVTVEGKSVAVSLDPVMINTANVISADIKASNGVIHVLDSVLIPDGVLPEEPEPTIFEIAVGNTDFSTLVSLLQMAGLVDTLSGPGPFTVFAPTNAAFDALPEKTVGWLTAPENKGALAKVLTYHVVSGNVMSTDLSAEDVPTVEGSSVAVSLNPVMINSAKVTTADIKASNGVIHVVDSVLVPDGVLPVFSTAPETTDKTTAPDSAGSLTGTAGNFFLFSSALFLSLL